jgi:hypothetical protein
MPYIIKDENGEAMRLVRRHEEAKHIIDIYTNWTMEYIKEPKPDLPPFEEAPF